jgi:hypothetical protein
MTWGGADDFSVKISFYLYPGETPGRGNLMMFCGQVFIGPGSGPIPTFGVQEQKSYLRSNEFAEEKPRSENLIK